MATKRGRPPKSDAERKSGPISVRLTPRLRERLEQRLRDSDGQRTLSQEIEGLLRRALEEDDRINDWFGGSTNRWLFQTMARQIPHIERIINGADINGIPKKRWWEDAFTFRQVKLL